MSILEIQKKYIKNLAEISKIINDINIYNNIELFKNNYDFMNDLQKEKIDRPPLVLVYLIIKNNIIFSFKPYEDIDKFIYYEKKNTKCNY